MQQFTGIYIENHKTIDAASKAEATQNLTGWQTESCAPEDWVKKLETGHTIQPSAFSPQPDGTFTHKFKYWNSTHFVCADADNIKGVEQNTDGSEKNPNGVEHWTETDGLSKRYPDLKSKAYAVGQSVSSMSEDKPPKHRRYRLIFLFDKTIESKEHYHQILLSLSNAFPIIPNDKRTPSQPVFGNARDGFPFHICGNVLTLDDYPYEPEPEAVSTPPSAQITTDMDVTLESYLQSHRVAYTPCEKETGKYFVECPNKSNHTGDINKPKDAYVFDDGKWSFNCSHTSCKKKGDATWEAFKIGYGISNGYNGTPKPIAKAKVKTEKPNAESEAVALDTPDNPFFEGKKFLPLGMVSYFESTGLHTLSLKHENFVRVYNKGIYREEQGEILHAMKAALGERTFKMSMYNEVIDYLQVNITPLTECEQSGYLNVKNGFLNLETLNLEKHAHDRKSIVQLPTDFDPSANPTKIEAWLTDCLYGDKEQETLFYEAVGYTLLQTTEMQKMFFLLGRTQTGKSTAAHILKGLIGEENISAIELAPLDDEDNRFSRANLTDKIANFSCDISPKYLTGDGNIKKIVSGDPITGEFKFRSPFTFQSTCTMWAMANALPPSGDKSDAWYERFVILRFDKQFLATGENKPDRTLKHTLTEPSELSGLLNVALICGKELLSRGHFTESAKNAEAVENYKFLNDHVLKFLTETDDLPYGDVDFYAAYKWWCQDEGLPKPLSKTRLADATQKHGINRIRKGADGNRHFAWVKTQKS